MKRMTWIFTTVMVGWMATGAWGVSVMQSIALDNKLDVRIAEATETITYSTQWSTPVGESCTVSVEAPDGAATVLKEVQPPESGTVSWQNDLLTSGLYTLTHATGSEVLTANFIVKGIPPLPVTIEVQNVMIRSRWPFEKKVDISYDIVSNTANAQATVAFKGYDQTRNAEPITLTTLVGGGANEQSVGVGSHSVVWDVGTDYPNFEAQSYTIEVSASVGDVATAVMSTAICIDTRTTQGGALALGTVSLPTHQGEVTLNGVALSEVWDTTAHADGWYALGQGVASTQVLVLNAPTILAGRLTQDQAFATDSLTVIHGDVIIPLGKTLTLASGAVLKFTSGAQLIVETGGLIDASGACLTHLAADTLLGDTNHDGGATVPIKESWTSGQALSWVSFDAQSNDANLLPVRTYSAGKTYGVLFTPTRIDYRFDGWYTAPIDGTKVIASSVVLTGETMLYAYWTVIIPETVATPTFTPATGTTFESTLAVTLTCATPEATMYYTTDGSTPTANSASYTAPITLIATTTIKARAFKLGMTDSGVATATYTKKPTIGIRMIQGLRVTIVVMPPSGSYVYAVEESIETGITPVDIDNNGIWDAVNRRVKWGPFFDANPRVFSYTIEGDEGTYTLFGEVSVDGESTTISGPTTITISLPQYHPADTSTDWVLSMNECTAYAKAWKVGEHANMNYATRGGYLWRLGEVYVDTLSYALTPDSDSTRWVPAGSMPANPSATALSTGTMLGLVREIRGASVSLQATPKSQTMNYALSESIPVGLTPTAISHDGAWDSQHRQVKWGPFYDNVARTFTCTLEGNTGRYHLMGQISEDGISLLATGDTQVILGDIAPSPIDVPTTWLDKYASPTNGDYAEAAVKPTGKTDIHGQPLLYWHEYLTGTKPDVADDIFHAIIRIENGIPVFTWKPDLKNLRVYTQEGKATLTDPWKTPPPDNAQFFRVKVQLP